MPRSARPLITSEELAELEPEWAALHATVPAAPPMLHPSWYAAWLRQFGIECAPVFLAVRREEELLGVVPLDMQAGSAVALGDANVCDYAGPLVLPGAEEDLARGLFEWLMEDFTPALDLWGIVAQSPIALALVEAANFWGWSAETEVEAVCPRMLLPATFENYLAGLAKHDRHELRRKLRNLEATGAVAFACEPPTHANLERLFAMMRASRADKAEFLTPAMEAFFRDLGRRVPGATIATLSLDGEPVASLFCFDSGGMRFLYNSGYNSGFEPVHNRLATGLLSKALSVRDAIERGLSEYDFLRGDERYKLEFGGIARQLVTMRFRRR